MSGMHNLTYENFIRSAFTKAYGQEVGRWGDPAALANTDTFDADQLSKVKAGISYSMSILNHFLIEDNELSEAQYNDIESILNRVLSSQNKMDIYDLIEEYKSKYFNILSL